jgi:hypothetical protein
MCENGASENRNQKSNPLSMKIQNKQIVLSLVIVIAVGIITVGCNKADDGKVESDVKTTAQDTATATADALSAGKDKAVELATNTSAVVQTGWQKAGDVATNVAASVTPALSNAWKDVKSVTTNAISSVTNLVH